MTRINWAWPGVASRVGNYPDASGRGEKKKQACSVGGTGMPAPDKPYQPMVR
jgi:hypothetical protein